MAKLDKIKEQIGWLKVIFGLLFAIIFVNKKAIDKIDSLEEL